MEQKGKEPGEGRQHMELALIPCLNQSHGEMRRSLG